MLENEVSMNCLWNCLGNHKIDSLKNCACIGLHLPLVTGIWIPIGLALFFHLDFHACAIMDLLIARL
jgi:hypothetical protein